MRNTKKVTGDALMYLLTIIKNTRGKRKIPIAWEGNLPADSDSKRMIHNSGYLRFMQTEKKPLTKTDEHIQIQTGQGYEYSDKATGESIDIRTKIVDFTCEKLNKKKTEINFLMTMLTEMITNIKDHAYDAKENIFDHKWYIFVENTEDRIKYTFMDNGLGIPTTIKKSAFEKLVDIVWEREYKYIESGISGLEKRSKTGQVERGNGLPSIYEQYMKGFVDKLIIISNKAYYIESEPKDLRNSLNGTIFYWEIKKEGTG